MKNKSTWHKQESQELAAAKKVQVQKVVQKLTHDSQGPATVNWLIEAEKSLKLVRCESNELILFYSGGKDSVVMLDIAAKLFDKVYCVFMYFVPGLRHIEKYIDYTKSHYKNVEFIEVQHWANSRIFKGGLYCTPNPNIKQKKFSDIHDEVRTRLGDLWLCIGFKQSDSLNRLLMLRTYESFTINRKTKKIYPLSYAKKKDILRYIKLKKLPEPIQYGNGKINGCGFNVDCFLYLRKYYPDDLKKILKVFPKSEQILFEHDYKASKVSGENNK